MAEKTETMKAVVEVKNFEELKEFIETMTDSTLVSIELKLVLENE